ncbi:MAG TPA: choice-of-anchor tandem repeat GloVer-containing protein [Candidatus Eremiobacteraceae bacterium]|nr:choice-of-anchor tandem repeat GloVer-containing protein [Candidatus Eremiobacteraceae bacterium]
MKTSTHRTPSATLAATSLSSELSTIAPARSRKADNVRKITLSKMVCIVSVFCAATAIISPAQTKFSSLFSFEGTNGANPHYVDLVQGIDGELYGTTYSGTGDGGKVFKITTAGKLTTLYSFCSKGEPCTDGAQPDAGLMLATNGSFYGTTMNGGADGDGTVFEITSAGKLTTLHSFDSTAGAEPEVGLIQATNGNLYGTASSGGTGDVGTIFEITPAGTFTSLLSFDGANGDYPDARLLQGTNGNFYGTTYEVSSGDGTVFEITPAGKLTTLHTFHTLDGGGPMGALIQATNGNFYGTTVGGGAHLGGGTVFEITPAGKLTTLYSFCSESDCKDGSTPYAGLIQATDGNLYGTTFSGGANTTACNGGCGTLIKITTAGKLTTLYNFCAKSNCTDGSSPQGGLLQDTNGNFYGTTYYGGTDGIGTIFSLSVGLGPFVKALPASGKVGAAVIILGTNLTGTTKVSFNGTEAAFTVVSATEIKTTVPTGASTGSVTVVTPSGTLKSNVEFRIP